MESFYEGLFTAISKSTEAESFLPAGEQNLLDYYLSMLESYVRENVENTTPDQKQRFEDVTAYLSAEIEDQRVKFYITEYVDHFGSSLKQFVTALENLIVTTGGVVVVFAEKTYEIVKELLIKMIHALQEVFQIAKAKFNEALHVGKAIVAKTSEILKTTIDNIRQAFFAAVAYASNALKTIFTGIKAKLESLSLLDLQTYSSMPLAYFAGKIFNEFVDVNAIFDDQIKVDKIKVEASMEDMVHGIKQFLHKTSDVTSEFGKSLKDSFAKLSNFLEKTWIQHKVNNIPTAVDLLNENNKYYESFVKTNDQQGIELIQKVNERFADDVLQMSIDYYQKGGIDQTIAKMIAQNDQNIRMELLKFYNNAVEAKLKLMQYMKNLDETIGKYDPAKVQAYKEKVEAAIKYLDAAANKAKQGMDIANAIQKNKLLADKVFKQGIFIVASAGVLYYAYAIAKQLHPVYTLLTATGITMGLLVVLLAVKFAIEYAVPLKAKILEVKANLADMVQQGKHVDQPEAIAGFVFLVSLGLLAGTVITRLTLSVKDGRKAGERAGKMLATL